MFDTGSCTATATQEPSAYVVNTASRSALTLQSEIPTIMGVTSASRCLPPPGDRPPGARTATSDQSGSAFPSARQKDSLPAPGSGPDAAQCPVAWTSQNTSERCGKK